MISGELDVSESTEHVSESSQYVSELDVSETTGYRFFSADSFQLYNTPEYHLYICSLGVQLVLHHPELYIERNYAYSWQNYVNNMARQGTWADNIIQAVANSMNITINIIGKVSIRAKCGPPGQSLS